MHRRDVDRLDLSRTYWVPVLEAPQRDWAAAPGCREGARFIVNCATLRVSREEFEPFTSRLDCLQWIMQHRVELNCRFPGASIRVAQLDRWLLGLD
ncbi:hypothetical protein IAI18_19370 [Acetobacteraceae bacterium H6797]|nr:hypothetical protein [Acetobacteraceae bacterium H6797]